jgi:hypothetical protein
MKIRGGIVCGESNVMVGGWRGAGAPRRYNITSCPVFPR